MSRVGSLCAFALLSSVIVACHKEPPPAPPSEPEGCYGARCVEEAEAALYYGDEEGAREPLAAVCEGDSDDNQFACFRLAELHRHGRGGGIDLVKAAELYEKSCADDFAEGCEKRAELARDDGQGGPEIELDFALKACEGSRPKACLAAAAQLHDGRGVEPDIARSIELYESACGQGEVEGCDRAGDLLFDPRGEPEVKARAFAAFTSACTGRSGYGCFKIGLALHEGIGTPVSVEAAQAQFTRACELEDANGCAAAKQLAAAKGKSATLQLSTSVDKLAADGLEARELSCRMDEQGPRALRDMLINVARVKRSLDRCVEGGVAVKVVWEFDGRVEEARIRGRVSGKTSKCLADTMKRVRTGAIGRCDAVLLLGDPEAAEASFAARASK
ncbi:MAG: tetratricopeptide repeat protein [Nannocystaceae bacterium]|nr:sel1 repeat family protein [Myxococcales bacterium]